MHSLRKVLVYLVPLAVFVFAALALSYYKVLDIRSQPLLIIVGIYVLAQTTRFVSSFITARRSQKKRAKYQGVIEQLGILSRRPKLLIESSENRTQTPESIAVKHLADALSASGVNTKLFVAFTVSQQQFSYPEGVLIAKQFISEVQDYDQKMKKTTPVLWSGPSLFGSIVARQQKLAPALEIEEPSVSRLMYRREVASQEFGESFCLTVPLFFEHPPDETTHSAEIIGVVGFLSTSMFTPPVSSHLETLVDRFKTLYTHVRSEQLSMLMDDELNRGFIDKMSVEDGNAHTDLKESLKSIFAKCFNAGRVELWLRGEDCSPSDSIVNVVAEVVDDLQSHVGTHGGGAIAGYDFHLDSAIELNNCVLGYIRILRNHFAFSEFDIDLLRKIESDLDNYVRDFWAYTVLRRLDHAVLNRAYPTISQFAKEFIRSVVVELGATAGMIDLRQQGTFRYTTPGSNTEMVNSQFDELLKRYEQITAPSFGFNVGSKEYQHIYLVISVGTEEPLGALYILRKGQLTETHYYILERIEANIDNILKLYGRLTSQ